jgi:hypothetical protein
MPSKPGGDMMEDDQEKVREALRVELNEIYKDIIGTEKFFSAMFTLHKLVSNIANAPDEEKFRRLNLSNLTISALFENSPAIEKFFRVLQFRSVEKDQFLQVGYPGQPLSNMQSFHAAINELEEFGNKISEFVFTYRSPEGEPWSGWFFVNIWENQFRYSTDEQFRY